MAIAATLVASAATASGQTVPLDRPKTLHVGTPAAGARTERIDGARTGRSRTALPTSHLHAEWRTPLGTIVDHPPLVDLSGTMYVVGTRGEAIAVARDGTERWRCSTGAGQPGPAALLADGTLVFVGSLGEAVAVRAGAVRWRTRFGRAETLHAAPLPLDDGGVVVATSRELAALDADGEERARATLPEPTAAPLVAVLGSVIAVGASGAVWSWKPGAPEVVRAGSFGSPLDGAAALADDHTLVAVVAGQMHLTAVDLSRGTSAVRSVAPPGSLWLGPPAMLGQTAYVGLLTPGGELAVALEPTGIETFRTLLEARTPQPQVASPDGGAPALVAAPHTASLVDAAGVVAFATIDGAIGVATAKGAELLSQDVCEPPVGAFARSLPPVVGLAPLEAGAFVATCRAGALLAVQGRSASGGGGG